MPLYFTKNYSYSKQIGMAAWFPLTQKNKSNNGVKLHKFSKGISRLQRSSVFVKARFNLPVLLIAKESELPSLFVGYQNLWHIISYALLLSKNNNIFRNNRVSKSIALVLQLKFSEWKPKTKTNILCLMAKKTPKSFWKH